MNEIAFNLKTEMAKTPVRSRLVSSCAASGLCCWIFVLASLLLGLSQTLRASLITNVTVANVTPSSFSVVWEAADSTPAIAVFADAGGVTNLAGKVGIEAFPIHTGNPDLTEGYQRRLNAAALRQKAQSSGFMMMRVSDCLPNTRYYFRLTSTPATGSPENYPASGPLPSVTTAAQNSFVVNDQSIILNVPSQIGEGGIVLLTQTNAAYPLAAVVGDGVGTNQVFFNVNDLFALAGTGNFTPLGDQDFTVNMLSASPTAQAQTYTLTYTADFATALTSLVSANTEFLALDVGRTVLRAGQAGSVPIISEVNTNLSSIDLTLQVPSGHLSGLALQSLASQLDPTGTSISPQGTSAWLLHFAARTGQSIVGSNVLAQLAFTAASNQASAFVPLQVVNLGGTKTDSSAVSQTLAQSGRVVVIANQPLLEAGFASNGSRELTLFGKAWTSYAIEYSTNLNNPDGWNQVRHFAQTNMVTTFAGLGAPEPNAFYRALEFTPDPPVLDALRGTKQARTLLVYGQPGKQYTVLAKTNLSNVVPWTPVQTYALTNSFRYLTAPGSNSIIFYRLERN